MKRLLPQFIWLTASSITNRNTNKCRILKWCIVTLFPDLNGYEKWDHKAKELSHLEIFAVSDLERKATESEKKQGLDLAVLNEP